MPVCRKCGVDKDEHAFAFAWRWRARGIRQPICRDCRKVQNAEWYQRHGTEHRRKVSVNTAAARVRARAFISQFLS